VYICVQWTFVYTVHLNCTLVQEQSYSVHLCCKEQYLHRLLNIHSHQTLCTNSLRWYWCATFVKLNTFVTHFTLQINHASKVSTKNIYYMSVHRKESKNTLLADIKTKTSNFFSYQEKKKVTKRAFRRMVRIKSIMAEYLNIFHIWDLHKLSLLLLCQISIFNTILRLGSYL